MTSREIRERNSFRQRAGFWPEEGIPHPLNERDQPRDIWSGCLSGGSRWVSRDEMEYRRFIKESSRARAIDTWWANNPQERPQGIRFKRFLESLDGG
jgi:hypothetical protein